MADDEPVLRPLRETDLDALFRFRARLWPEGDYHRSRDYWDWNVMRNPHALSGQGPPVGLALRGAEVLAECQGLPAALLQAGLPRAASWCVELYTEPSAQRRGLGSRLVAQWISSAGIPLVMGPSRASHPVFVSAGLRPLGVLSSYLAPTGLLGLLLASFRGRGASAGPLPESRSISRFEPDWDPVWRAARGNAAHIRRDHAWLNWRFVEQPEVSYERLGFFRGGSPCGYAVLRAGADARCRLADLAVLPEALGGAAWRPRRE